METTPLHDDFGLRVDGVALRELAAEGYPAVRDLFDRHSLLHFPGQHLTDAEQLRLGRLFGPIEDRESRPEPQMSLVSNVKEGGDLWGENELRTLDLKANMLWHTDSTFLPVPALANICQARVVAKDGGATEFVSTRAGWRRLDPEMQARLRGAVFRHRLTHSRARIDPELAKAAHITRWPDQRWQAVWTNPETGEEALYIASHACAVDGMGEAEGQALIDALIAAMTPPEAVYRHAWREGDVLIWDERATLHRGMPWDYSQPRTLASICVTAQARDGLETVRPG